MKKIIIVILSAILIISLVGCDKAPSDMEIKTALKEGIITFDDAKSKGWIDDQWISENIEILEFESKIHLFTDFDTTYLDETAVSSKIIHGKMCLVFFDTKGETTKTQLEVYNSIYSEMESIGVPILGIITDKELPEDKTELEKIKFPIIVYNDDMKTSLADYEEIIDTDVVSVFTKEGGFYTAWNAVGDSEDLLTFAKVLADEE